MKKGLIFALAALIITAFAVPAMAAPTMTVNGTSQWVGYYISNPGAATAAADAEPKAFGTMETAIGVQIAIADNMRFWVGFEGLDRYWGSSSHKDINTGPSSAATSGVDWVNARLLYINKLGYWLIGTYKDNEDSVPGLYGPGGGGDLEVLGMQRSKVDARRAFLYHYGKQCDRLIYVKPGKTWKLTAFFQKVYEGDAAAVDELDKDYDVYYVKSEHFWKTGGAIASMTYSRIRVPGYGASGYIDSESIGTSGDTDLYNFNIRGAQAFGPIKVGGQIYYTMGTINEYAALGDDSWSVSSLAWYLEALYAAGPIEAGAAWAHTFYDPTSGSYSKTIGVGPAFRPLYAFYGEYTGLGNDLNNHDLFTAWFDYNVIKKLWIHVGYGWLQWAHTDDDFMNYDKQIGSEIDLGANYEVAKGLNVGLHFGYFMPAQGWEDYMSLDDSGAMYQTDVTVTLKF